MFKIKLKETEIILQKYRQSKWLLFRPALICAICMAVPLYLFFEYNLYPKYAILAAIWVLICLAYFSKSLTPWMLKRYLVTDQRVIVIFYESIFRKNVLGTPLDRILNVSYKNTGFSSSLMGYGNVEIQAVGLAELMKPLTLDNIPRPEHVKDYLWKIHETHKKRPEAYNLQKDYKPEQQI